MGHPAQEKSKAVTSIRTSQKTKGVSMLSGTGSSSVPIPGSEYRSTGSQSPSFEWPQAPLTKQALMNRQAQVAAWGVQRIMPPAMAVQSESQISSHPAKLVAHPSVSFQPPSTRLHATPPAYCAS